MLVLGLNDTIFPELWENSISIPSASRRMGPLALDDSVSLVGNVNARRIPEGVANGVALDEVAILAMANTAMMV